MKDKLHRFDNFQNSDSFINTHTQTGDDDIDKSLTETHTQTSIETAGIE
jgi:hypothetical protein